MKKIQENEKNKKSLKELYANYKEIKADPRRYAGMKLLGYLIFFVIFLLIAFISSHIDSYDNEPSKKTITTTTTEKTEKYYDKQQDLLKDKYTINYVIKINDIEYKINGNIENGVVEGYLENIDNIKKVIIKDNIYEVVNGEEKVLESDINFNYVDIKYLINLLKQSSSIKENINDEVKYIYNVENLDGNIIVYSNSDTIYKITILDGINEYNLNFDK